MCTRASVASRSVLPHVHCGCRRDRIARVSARRSALLVSAALLASACAAPRERGCAGGAQALLRDALYFGTATPDGTVSAAEWDAFLRDTVTPRFPDGLTVLGAAGQWRGADGVVVREPSYVLEVMHAEDAASERAIREIADAYKARFRQEAVMRVTSPACVAF